MISAARSMRADGGNVMKRNVRKLHLGIETIRHLDLRRAAGGLPKASEIHSDCCQTTSNACTDTTYCPDTGFPCTFRPTA